MVDSSGGALRIVHLPDVVGGHPIALSHGERALGHHSETLSYIVSPFGYTADRLVAGRMSPLPFRWISRARAFFSIRNKFDVFHFNFGRSLLSSASGRIILGDLPYYPRESVKVMTFQGSDARLTYEPVLEESLEAEARSDPRFDGSAWRQDRLAAQVALRRRMIEKAARHCDAILALNPDLLAGLPEGKGRFFPYAIEPPLIDGAPRRAAPDAPLHVVHLSTNRVLKGTALIERALRQAAERFGITFEIIVRKPRPEAIAALHRADVVVDQMVLGWYGAAAVEAAYLGKPVVTWLSPRQLEAAPQDLRNDLPFLNVAHQDLVSAIGRFVADRSMAEVYGDRARRFALAWHGPRAVASQALEIYREAGGVIARAT